MGKFQGLAANVLIRNAVDDFFQFY